MSVIADDCEGYTSRISARPDALKWVVQPSGVTRSETEQHSGVIGHAEPVGDALEQLQRRDGPGAVNDFAYWPIRLNSCTTSTRAEHHSDRRQITQAGSFRL